MAPFTSDVIFFPMIDASTGVVSVGMTRKAGDGGVNGAGVVARVQMQIAEDAENGTEVTLSVRGIAAMDATGSDLTLSEGTGSFVIGGVAVEEESVSSVPEAYALLQNMPNPFNPSTTIPYALPRAGAVRLGVYNLRGNLVRVLVDGWKEPGHYQVVWDGRDRQGQQVSSGIYVVRLEAGERIKQITFSQARRITLIR